MEFDKSKFIGQFKSETREHLQRLNGGLLKLEKNRADKPLLDEMMREAHTIKGSAAMMGFKRISDIAHGMETGLEKALKGQVELKKAHFDILFKCLDSIDPLLEDKIIWESKGMTRPYVDDLCAMVRETFMPEKPGAPVTTFCKEPLPAAPVVPEESLRVEIDKLDKLMNLSGELIVSNIRLNELVKNITRKEESRLPADESISVLIKEMNRVDENISFVSSNIQSEVMKVRMVPISYLFNLFPRAMRDLAHASGKAVNIEIRGEDTHLDKAIVDEMKDPIMHLLRNSVDHGIESAEERRGKKKPESGKISLNAYHAGSQVIIEVSDDGKGIDIEKVKKKAVEKGIITAQKADTLVDEQAFQLLFLPGFSTADTVTEVSGRGVGLDVVQERIAKLKGTIEITSVKDIGTKFIMKVPLTLAITECLLVAAGIDVYAVPIDAVVETIRISLDEIKTVETREAITVRGQIMPLVRLKDIFVLPEKGITERKYFSVVVVQSVEKKMGVLVDSLMGRQDIVTKALGEPLKNVRYVSSATILGDGRVILILDIPSIIGSFEGGAIVKTPKITGAPSAPAKKGKKTILLAEDALSTAMLEKNILESAGFSVVIARDGKEALEKMFQERFDLVITDVLMPRMDGFELTTNLKKDKLYKDIPVIIVTTRESDADKRRGLEAGADAYILKSEFTSEGLLNTIERLVG